MSIYSNVSQIVDAIVIWSYHAPQKWIRTSKKVSSICAKVWNVLSPDIKLSVKENVKSFTATARELQVMKLKAVLIMANAVLIIANALIHVVHIISWELHLTG